MTSLILLKHLSFRQFVNFPVTHNLLTINGSIVIFLAGVLHQQGCTINKDAAFGALTLLADSKLSDPPLKL